MVIDLLLGLACILALVFAMRWPASPGEVGRSRFVLLVLVRFGRMRGLDMVRMSGGILRRGVVYVTLTQMEERGLIESERDLGGRVYAITEQGRVELRKMGTIRDE